MLPLGIEKILGLDFKSSAIFYPMYSVRFDVETTDGATLHASLVPGKFPRHFNDNIPIGPKDAGNEYVMYWPELRSQSK
ncbi:uncharacterized protein PADG_08133 [Paracoccidioides brasiliensis Pb18]|uniref:Uncharacterized protein n=2 Tax=Paracoccidioides brasiliensis TaxID=121759 RepID=C1GM47_PARBD|nr:uncharacterized protein PADG_08133 [Paracoccidioides brasiliensis Pb18]EEH43513.2 hypothetical protein PADG_08133 [Paracoccidioides brasiliensis Pb18]ODH13192.1 hypothetical protein ACO22_07508 [Paracoccidioides brasiliensis]